jgi:hypothetical protein
MSATGTDAVLMVRLDCLKRAIEARDWPTVEFEYDRVLSAAAKLTGTRGRPYDPRPGIVHVSSTDRGHHQRCRCGRLAVWHVASGDTCGNVCGVHKRAAARQGPVVATAIPSAAGR